MKLKSKRLETVLNLLEKNTCLADIGCDHGFLSIQYAFENYPTNVYAIDEKKMPLESCRKNIIECASRGISLDNIQLICSSGFESIKEDCKQIAICGVGGDNIIDMFKKFGKNVEKVETFVFEPNNNCYFLRCFMVENDYKIVEEKIIEEDDVIYEIIKYKKGHQKLSEKEKFFGPLLLKEKSEIFKRKYYQELKKLEKIYSSIPDIAIENKRKISTRIELIKEVL